MSDVNVLEIVNRNKIQFETGGEAVEAVLLMINKACLNSTATPKEEQGDQQELSCEIDE